MRKRMNRLVLAGTLVVTLVGNAGLLSANGHLQTTAHVSSNPAASAVAKRSTARPAVQPARLIHSTKTPKAAVGSALTSTFLKPARPMVQFSPTTRVKSQLQVAGTWRPKPVPSPAPPKVPMLAQGRPAPTTRATPVKALAARQVMPPTPLHAAIPRDTVAHAAAFHAPRCPRAA
jgi:hypothetical protein